MVTQEDSTITISREELLSIVKEANCTREIPMPHTWPELIWCGVKILGVGTVITLAIVAVAGAIAWVTLPQWVSVETEFKKSLTNNLVQQTKNLEHQGSNMDRQTLNIEAQTKNINAQTEAIREVQTAVAGIAQSTATRDEQWREFSNSVNDVHQMQCETQCEMVETLEAIKDALVQ